MRTKKNDIHIFPKKENRRTKQTINIEHPSTNSPGSVPKRYQSVFSKGTPLTSFGVKHDENYLRSHSPSNHIQSKTHQRSFKPVTEFLSTHQLVNSQLDDRRQSSSHTNNFTRSQTEATIQNVNIALTRTFNKLRQERLHSDVTNARSSTIYTEPSSSRPVTTYQNTGTTTSSNYYYQLPSDKSRPLPPELTTRRPTKIFLSNVLPPNNSSNRISTETSLPVVHRSTTTPNEHTNIRSRTPLRTSSKNQGTDLNELDKFNFNNVALDEHPKKPKTDKTDINHQKVKSRQQSPAPPYAPPIDKRYRTLTEVSVHPQMQSTVQQNTDQLPDIYQPIVTGEIYTNHHRIQVEPTNEVKRITSPPSSIKSQQIIDLQPNITVQYQRLNSPIIKDPLNEAYLDRDHIHTQLLTVERTHTNDNDNISASKQDAMNNLPILSAPPSSPSNPMWKKSRNKNPIRTGTGTLVTRKNHRPSGRLKNYGDDSDSELTVTETQSKEYDIAHQNDLLPSDATSDVWSDLTSEFSDIKLRRYANIRTSTPNITQSSSLSSKEFGQMRKQLNNLQTMYNDLLKLFENDIETIKTSTKSNTPSETEHNGRKHRFRKVMPVIVQRQSNIDIKEINQRFTRLESSIITLAESIAKLSTQVQMQRVIKDDLSRLHEEIAELRQQLSQQKSSIPTNVQISHLITANIQHLAAINNINPINISTSYQPSNSIIHPRQARKIEQEEMLRYFLSLLHYDEYSSILEQEKIDFCELPFIDERKLQGLGIPYGPSIRIIHEAQQYFTSLLTLKSNGIYV
ncbi:unnamed protein product [Adineta steineri]|uniref:SAM domain-containing protein n=1 Tax=Adineta steineri TaxID=433720 RepID=A0A814YC69_9BILA|nr:unnamed protein product [Adineta steineri]